MAVDENEKRRLYAKNTTRTVVYIVQDLNVYWFDFRIRDVISMAISKDPTNPCTLNIVRVELFVSAQ